MNIGSMIYKYRTSNNMTQQELATQLNVLPQTISKWERGNGNPDIYLLPKIAKCFGISLDDLFDVYNNSSLNHIVAEASFNRNFTTFINAFSEIEKHETKAKYSNDLDLLKRLVKEKVHLYLQLQWFANENAVKECKKWIDQVDEESNEEFKDATLQLIQLESISKKGRSSNYEYYKNYFESSPSFISLELYFFSLYLENDTNTIINLWNKLRNTKYMQVTKESASAFSLFLEFALEQRLFDFVDEYYPTYLKVASDKELFHLHNSMIKYKYGCKDNIKKLLLKEVKFLKNDKEWYDKAIEEIEKL